MGHWNRGYGLMAGITVGFAVWGSVGGAGRNGEKPAAVLEEQDLAAVDTGKESLSLHALSAVLIDGDSGRVLYEKEGSSFRPMASTTKIMTCIIALENGNLEDICTVSGTAASQPKVHLGVRKGQQFYLRDLLYSLMLESHNDSAVVIAEHIGGSVERFADLMNQKARDLGCKETFFVTPNGLDASVTAKDGTVFTHGTTAAELARIMRYCIRESPKREEFLAVTGTKNYSFQDCKKKNSYSCVNHNALLSMIDGAISGKTGFTGGAGYSYVGAVENGDRTFVLALLGCGWPPHKSWKWEDAKKLLTYGQERYHYSRIKVRRDFPKIPVPNGIGKKGEKEASVTLTYGNKENQDFEILLAEGEHVKEQVKLPSVLEAPVEAGSLVGVVEYRLNDDLIRMEPVYAAHPVREKTFLYYQELVGKCFFLEKKN